MKILMISDYNMPAGGIEQYVRDASQLLGTKDHIVTVLGLRLSSRLFHRLRPLLMPVTLCNIWFAAQLIRAIHKHKPDLIWWHSVSRYIWRFPLWVAGLYGIRSWMMYHDLGYVHPYPSLLTDVSQIPQQRSLRSWITAGKAVGKTSIIATILMALKFWGMTAIRAQLLSTVSLHLVPSPYMVDIFHQWWISKKNVQVLGHFGRVE